MIRLKLSTNFETPARRGLMRANSQFIHLPPPIMTKRTFRVFSFGEGTSRNLIRLAKT